MSLNDLDGWRSRLRRAEFFTLVLVLGFVFVLTVLAFLVGADNIKESLARLDPTTIALMVALSLVNYGIRAGRWHIYSLHLGMQVPWSRSLKIFIAGFAMGTTPGRIGEALRLWFLARDFGYRYRMTTPLLIADRISDVNGLTLLLLSNRSFQDVLF